jgi:ApaG protein
MRRVNLQPTGDLRGRKIAGDSLAMQHKSSREGHPSANHIYERVTRGVRVQVEPAYLDDQSDPESGRYLWSYTVTIENRGSETVQLISRYWHITDAMGRIKEVRGPGVIGAQPVLEPGQVFEYTSGCPLPTTSGAMSGCYQMRAASGEAFEAEIPPFLLELPHERRQIH